MSPRFISNTIKIALGILAITTIVGLTSCNKDNPVIAEDALYSATLPDADETASDVTDATTTEPYAMVTPASDERRINDFGVRVLRRMLKLTDDQKAQIRVFHQQHEQCFRTIRDSLRASEKTILAGYKPQYQAIRDNLKNGTIDTATAKLQLKDLTILVRNDLKNNPVRSWAKAEFITCRQAFYDNVRSILTDEQKAILEEWILLHKR